MERKKIYFYGNGSFLNKGCEAIARGTINIINNVLDCEYKSISDNPNYDKKMNVNYISENIDLLKGYNFIQKVLNKIQRNNKLLTKLKLKNVNNSIKDSDLCISLGGDNYCYKKNYYLMEQNKDIHEKLYKKTVLWGCSIDLDNIDDDIIKDMKRYDLITVRETITQENLKKNGIIENVKLVSDPAFTMDKKEITLPKEWEKNNTIGINLSPMILNNSINKEKVYKIFIEWIKYLLENTNYKIALIPHVFFPNNNDYIFLKKIYEDIKSERLILIGQEYTAEELKYIISNCNLFIGGRTHATIAAYSTNVPTLVIGYSVKAKGIAKDIFGDYKNYVISIQELDNTEQLIEAYKFIENNKEKIKKYLEDFMPNYIQKAWDSGEYIKQLIER